MKKTITMMAMGLTCLTAVAQNHTQNVSSDYLNQLSTQFVYNKKIRQINELEIHVQKIKPSIIPSTDVFAKPPVASEPKSFYRKYIFKPNIYPNITHSQHHTHLPESSWHGEIISLLGNWEIWIERGSLNLPNIQTSHIEIEPLPKEWSKGTQEFTVDVEYNTANSGSFYKVKEQCTIYPSVLAQFLHPKIKGKARKLICQQIQVQKNSLPIISELSIYTAYFLEDYQFVIPFSKTIYDYDGTVSVENVHIKVFR